MKSETITGQILELLDQHIERCPSAEERESLVAASGAAALISFSGQIYRFEEFRNGISPPQPMGFDNEIHLLEHKRAIAPSAEEKETLLAAMDALRYVESSAQREGLEDYLGYWENRTHPPVVAVFKTRAEADAWLDALPVPPKGARVLIGDEYHSVMRSRERRDPGFLPIPIVAEHIEDSRDDGLPAAVASFDTREEAEAWLASTPEPPRHAEEDKGGQVD